VVCEQCGGLATVPPPPTAAERLLRHVVDVSIAAAVGALVVGVAAAVTTGGTEANRSWWQRALGAAPLGALIGVAYHFLGLLRRS
jgi:hypothetical protein